MGIWAELKKSVNSTIGTDEITPLDEMIGEVENRIKTKIVTPSDNVLATLITEEIANTGSGNIIVGRVSINGFAGTIRVFASVYKWTVTSQPGIRIATNSGEIKLYPNSTGTYETLTTEFPVSDKDVLTISIFNYGGDGTNSKKTACNLLTLCGDVTVIEEPISIAKCGGWE